MQKLAEILVIAGKQKDLHLVLQIFECSIFYLRKKL